MRDQGLIYPGLLVFLLLVTYPIWHDMAAGVSSRGPEPVLGTQEKQCVAPRDYMRNSHMDLLNNWRDQVVRYDRREYTAPDGRRFNMSLTNTCLNQCHRSKADFCDRCHNYAGVSPYCWDCHVDPKLVQRRASR